MQFNIAKTILLIILIPVIFSIPLLLAAKFTNIWQESNNEKRDLIFIRACTSTVVIAAFLFAVGFIFNYEILSLEETSSILFLVQSIYFIKKGYKKVEWQKLSWPRRNFVFGELLFKEAWKTNYHWGTVTQLLLLLLINFA